MIVNCIRCKSKDFTISPEYDYKTKFNESKVIHAMILICKGCNIHHKLQRDVNLNNYNERISFSEIISFWNQQNSQMKMKENEIKTLEIKRDIIQLQIDKLKQDGQI